MGRRGCWQEWIPRQLSTRSMAMKAQSQWRGGILGNDRQLRFHVMDGAEFLRGSQPGQFDLIYADAWAGKFSQLDEALALLRPGGVYHHRRFAATSKLA